MSKTNAELLLAGRSKNGKLLMAARELMERERIFGPGDHALFLHAALEDGFDPATNGTDAKIDTLLHGVYGFPWRAHIVAVRDEDLFDEDERAELMAAAAAFAAKEIVHNRELDELFAAEGLIRNPPRTATVELLRSIGTRYDKALRAWERARAELEEAQSKVTAVKVRAQRRRTHEATATMELNEPLVKED